MEKDSNLLDDMFSDDYISSAHCSLTALTEPSPIAMNIQPCMVMLMLMVG